MHFIFLSEAIPEIAAIKELKLIAHAHWAGVRLRAALRACALVLNSAFFSAIGYLCGIDNRR